MRVSSEMNWLIEARIAIASLKWAIKDNKYWSQAAVIVAELVICLFLGDWTGSSSYWMFLFLLVISNNEICLKCMYLLERLENDWRHPAPHQRHPSFNIAHCKISSYTFLQGLDHPVITCIAYSSCEGSVAQLLFCCCLSAWKQLLLHLSSTIYYWYLLVIDKNHFQSHFSGVDRSTVSPTEGDQQRRSVTKQLRFQLQPDDSVPIHSFFSLHANQMFHFWRYLLQPIIRFPLSTRPLWRLRYHIFYIHALIIQIL